MIDALIRFSLQQRLLTAVITLVLLAFGLHAVQNLSVDAFPDVTNVQVQIATEAPGRSPEDRPPPQGRSRVLRQTHEDIRFPLPVPVAPQDPVACRTGRGQGRRNICNLYYVWQVTDFFVRI